MTSAIASKLASPAHRLAALLFTDIVDSTKLKTVLRAGYMPLLARHNELFETSIEKSPDAEIIKCTGDGYFASFPTASDAVRFALMFQDRMRQESWGSQNLETRVGIHIGEVVFMDMGGRKDIIGLSADVAARLMSLAVGGQILLTETAFNDARQYVNSSPDRLDIAQSLRWIAHGPYAFKGAEEPLEVYEVGIEKCAPLMPPADSEKARRVVPGDEESTLGWRPGAALPIPGRPGWQLVRKLGEGGFGEVWLGEHQKLKEVRVFKFCFDAERLRSLKREYSLYRLLRESLGRRPDIATLYEVRLEDPPFFLESEYSDAGNLLEWGSNPDGMSAIPMAARLELLAKIADAVAAAHSVGVLHKDIKPSNVLLYKSATGAVLPRLADFGIGMLSDRSRLKSVPVTVAYTELTDGTNAQSTGTRMYAPPESMLDLPFTTRGDVFALGVMLYQIAVNDFLRPLATGWEREIEDEILREDIAAIVEGVHERRVATAEEVAGRVRSMDARRTERAQARDRDRAMQRRARLRRAARWVGAALGCLLIGIGISVALHIRDMHRERAKTLAATTFLANIIKNADPENPSPRGSSAENAILEGAHELDRTFVDDTDINADLHMCFATVLRDLRDPMAVDCYLRAAKIDAKLHGDDDPRTLAARFGQGYALLKLQRFGESEPVLSDVLDRQRRVLGPEDRRTLSTAMMYAGVIAQMKGPLEAEPHFREVLESRRKNFGEDDKDTIQSISACAWMDFELGRLDEARKLAGQAMDWRAAHFGPNNFITLSSRLMYESILVEVGQSAEAEPKLKQLVELFEISGADKTDALRAKAVYADALTALHRYPDAENYYHAAMTGLAQRAQGDRNLYAMSAMTGYAELLTATDHADEAEKKAREARDTLAKVYGMNRRETLRATYALACALDLLKKPEARGEFQAAADGAARTFGPNSPITQRYAQRYSAFIARGAATVSH